MHNETPPPIAPAPTVAAPAQVPLAAPPLNMATGDRFYARVFGLAAAAILGLVLYRIVAPFVGPMMWALLLAFLLHPLHVRLTRRFKGRENLSASLLTLGAFVMLAGPLAGMSAAFVAQAADLVQWLQEKLARQSDRPFSLLSNVPMMDTAMQWLRDTFGVKPGQIQSWMAQATEVLPKFLAGLGGQIFLGAVNTVLAFIIMLFMLYFFVRDGDRFLDEMSDLIPLPPARRTQLVDYIAAVARAVVFGMGVTALVQGALVGVGFLIVGFSSPLVFGVLAALLALLPFGGTALVWVPAVLVLGAQSRWGMAVVMLVIGIISSSIDNVLRPLLISGRAEVSTIVVFVGVLGGTAAFGPTGLFLGPITLALILALLRFARETRRAGEMGMPS
jgi:predicted PurR-regulated permease PerM